MLLSSVFSRAYENNIIPKSYRTPHLILFYSDWCFPCLQVEPVWRRIMEELEPIGNFVLSVINPATSEKSEEKMKNFRFLGIGIATVHAENEKALARKVGIPALPSLILVLEGRPRIYKESLFSVQKVVGEWIAKKIQQ